MILEAKILQSNNVVGEFEIKDADWENLCDLLIEELLRHFEDVSMIETLIKSDQYEENKKLLEKWQNYTKENDIRTMKSFVYALESNRSDFMKLLILNEMIGIYYLMMYGSDNICFSVGQIHDIYDALHIISLNLGVDDHVDPENLEKCMGNFNKLLDFFTLIKEKYSILVESR